MSINFKTDDYFKKKASVTKKPSSEVEEEKLRQDRVHQAKFNSDSGVIHSAPKDVHDRHSHTKSPIRETPQQKEKKKSDKNIAKVETLNMNTNIDFEKIQISYKDSTENQSSSKY